MQLYERLRPAHVTSAVARRLADLRLRAGVRLVGGNGFEYWGRRQDQSRINIDATAPNTWGPRSKRQFAFLKSIGLKPRHRFLDYGCARVATGEELIPYLEPGNYVGCDVGAASMQWGQRRLTANGVDRRRYHMISVTSPDLRQIEGFRFDFIWAYSVLQFLPQDDLRLVLAKFREMLEPGGSVVLTYSVDGDRDILRHKGMHVHGLDFYKQEMEGLSCQTAHPEIGNGKSNIAIFS